MANGQEMCTMTQVELYVEIQPVLDCNYIVKYITKNYRRKELSPISPSVNKRLPDYGECLFSAGDLVMEPLHMQHTPQIPQPWMKYWTPASNTVI